MLYLSFFLKKKKYKKERKKNGGKHSGQLLLTNLIHTEDYALAVATVSLLRIPMYEHMDSPVLERLLSVCLALLGMD